MKKLLSLSTLCLLATCSTLLGASSYEFWPVLTNMVNFTLSTNLNTNGVPLAAMVTGQLGGIVATNDGFAGKFWFNPYSAEATNATYDIVRSTYWETKTSQTSTGRFERLKDPAGSISGGQPLTAGTGLIGTQAGALLTAATLSLSNTTVTAGTYGSSTQSGQFYVDQQGRLTNASNVTITPAAGSITGAGNLTVGSGINITSGTGTGALLTSAGVSVDQGFSPTWTGTHIFTNVVTIKNSSGLVLAPQDAYSVPPTSVIDGFLKYNSGGSTTTAARLTLGKENNSDGDTGGYFTISTRTNTGSNVENFRVGSSGRTDITQGIITHGKIGSSGTVGRADAGIEIQHDNTTAALLSLFQTQVGVNAGTPGQGESSIAWVSKDAGGNISEMYSQSQVWTDASAGTGYGVERFSGLYNSGANQESDIRLFGGHGISLWGTDDTSTTAPGYHKFRNNGETQLWSDGSLLSGNWYYNTRVANSTVTRGLTLGYDNALVRGIIASEQANSTLGLVTHRNGTYGLRVALGGGAFRSDSDLEIQGETGGSNDGAQSLLSQFPTRAANTNAANSYLMGGKDASGAYANIGLIQSLWASTNVSTGFSQMTLSTFKNGTNDNTETGIALNAGHGITIFPNSQGDVASDGELFVRGSIRASTSITDSGLTTTRIPFADNGGLLADDSVLVWDKTNHRLGLGVTPTQQFSDRKDAVTPNVGDSLLFRLDNQQGSGNRTEMVLGGANNNTWFGMMDSASSATNRFYVSVGSVTEKLQVCGDGAVKVPAGNFSVSGTSTLTGAVTASTSVTDSGLTATQVVYADTAGLLAGDSLFVWDKTNHRLGLGTASPSMQLANRKDQTAANVGDASLFRLDNHQGTGNRVEMVLGGSQNNTWFGMFDSATSSANRFYVSVGGVTESLDVYGNGNVAVPNGNLTVSGTTTSTGIVNGVAGFQYNSLATSGLFLRANGTAYVGSLIQAADIPAAAFANPTSLIGMTVVNGTAATALRSDGASAIDPAIAPFWTGIHTFTNQTSSASLAIVKTNSSAQIFTSKLSGAANNLYHIIASGQMYWGSGGGSTVDTRLERSATNTLRVADNVVALGTVNAVSGFTYNGAAPNGHVLVGNGTAYVDGTVGGGTVTSVAASGPSGIATWSSAVTTSGTLTQTLSTQGAGKVFSGPASGSDAVPTFQNPSVQALWTKVADTTVANTTVATTLLDTGVGTKTIAASGTQAGTVIRLRASGTFGTKTATPGTLSLSWYIGSTLVSSVLHPVGNISVGGGWWSEFEWTIRTTGAGGTVVGFGTANYDDSTSVTDAVFGVASTLGSQAIDTTISQTINLKAVWATADTANTITCTTASIELINNQF